MAIRIQPAGLSELYAKAGAAIGSAEKAKRQAEQAQRQQELLLDIQARRAAAEQAQAFRLETMQLESQLQRDAQLRAQAWEVEKAEIRSRMDFEREEKERAQRIDSADNAIAALRKEVAAGHYQPDDPFIRNLILKYELEKTGVDVPVSMIYPPGQQQKSILQQMEEAERKRREEAAATEAAKAPRYTVTLAEVEQAASQGRAVVRDKETKTLTTLPIAEAKKAVDAGDAEWVQPEVPKKPPKRELEPTGYPKGFEQARGFYF